ncbi:hypothetical protein ACRAWD_24910 [Caulobacter segnis]
MLTAFAVVLATLVVQGLTLAPLVRLLRLDREDARAKSPSACAPSWRASAPAALDGKAGDAVDHWRCSLRRRSDRLSAR